MSAIDKIKFIVSNGLSQLLRKSPDSVEIRLGIGYMPKTEAGPQTGKRDVFGLQLPEAINGIPIGRKTTTAFGLAAHAMFDASSSDELAGAAMVPDGTLAAIVSSNAEIEAINQFPLVAYSLDELRAAQHQGAKQELDAMLGLVKTAITECRLDTITAKRETLDIVMAHSRFASKLHVKQMPANVMADLRSLAQDDCVGMLKPLAEIEKIVSALTTKQNTVTKRKINNLAKKFIWFGQPDNEDKQQQDSLQQESDEKDQQGAGAGEAGENQGQGGNQSVGGDGKGGGRTGRNPGSGDDGGSDGKPDGNGTEDSGSGDQNSPRGESAGGGAAENDGDNAPGSQGGSGNDPEKSDGAGSEGGDRPGENGTDNNSGNGDNADAAPGRGQSIGEVIARILQAHAEMAPENVVEVAAIVAAAIEESGSEQQGTEGVDGFALEPGSHQGSGDFKITPVETSEPHLSPDVEANSRLLMERFATRKGAVEIMGVKRYDPRREARGIFPLTTKVKAAGKKSSVKVVIGVDVSGSMGDITNNECNANLAVRVAQALSKSIVNSADVADVRGVLFDHEMYVDSDASYSWRVFNTSKEVGGGGTSFGFIDTLRDVFPDHIIIVVTDGDGSAPERSDKFKKNTRMVVINGDADNMRKRHANWCSQAVSVHDMKDLRNAVASLIPSST